MLAPPIEKRSLELCSDSSKNGRTSDRQRHSTNGAPHGLPSSPMGPNGPKRRRKPTFGTTRVRTKDRRTTFCRTRTAERNAPTMADTRPKCLFWSLVWWAGVGRGVVWATFGFRVPGPTPGSKVAPDRALMPYSRVSAHGDLRLKSCLFPAEIWSVKDKAVVIWIRNGRFSVVTSRISSNGHSLDIEMPCGRLGMHPSSGGTPQTPIYPLSGAPPALLHELVRKMVCMGRKLVFQSRKRLSRPDMAQGHTT